MSLINDAQTPGDGKEVSLEERQRIKAERELRKQMKKKKKIGDDDATNQPQIEKTDHKVDDGKSKSELRAERRAKQEAQRAAKAQIVPVKSDSCQKEVEPVKAAKEKSPQKVTKSHPVIATPKIDEPPHTTLLFNHLLTQRTKETIDLRELHPSIVRLGVQYKHCVVTGSNARCLAMLQAVQDMIVDFHTPPQAEFSRSFETVLQKSVEYLDSCRPMAVSMTNTLRFIKYQLTQLRNNVNDEQGKKILLNSIDTYVREEIEMAGQAISISVQQKISNGDRILTLGCSSLINRILVDARQSGKHFQVVIVETGLFSGEADELKRRLLDVGIQCTYCLISAVSGQMRSVDKVLLGAHALLANGYVTSRIGTAQVALLAKSFNKPVLVCCETYKFCERVQTDSFVCNEIAIVDKETDVEQFEPETNENKVTLDESCPWVNKLNLTYDVTPPDLVTAVVTELGILPCTSVPVILRVKYTDS